MRQIQRHNLGLLNNLVDLLGHCLIYGLVLYDWLGTGELHWHILGHMLFTNLNIWHISVAYLVNNLMVVHYLLNHGLFHFSGDGMRAHGPGHTNRTDRLSNNAGANRLHAT